MPIKNKTLIFIVSLNLVTLGTVFAISYVLFGGYSEQERFFLISGVLIVIISILLGYFFVNNFLLDPLLRLVRGIKEIRTKKTFTSRLEAVGKDEFSSLAREINEMLEELQKSEINYIKANDELKQQKKELETKTAELERINKHMVGRELRMAELKEKIKDLEDQINAH